MDRLKPLSKGLLSEIKKKIHKNPKWKCIRHISPSFYDVTPWQELKRFGSLI